MDATTIDHFAVFIAVVEEGSFPAAGRRLNRTPAAITEAVQRLETVSQLLLFDRSTYRPSLTDAGRALLPRARQIVDDVEDYSLTARSIAKGLEAEVSLAVDALVPMPFVVRTLKSFHEVFSGVQVRVSLETFEGVLQALSQETVGLALIAFGHADHDLERAVCGEIDLIPVASSDHPLAQYQEPVEPQVLRGHLQLLLSTRSALRNREVYGVLSTDRWHVTDLETKHAMLLAGLGWGLMPEHRIAADLAAGRLVELRGDAMGRRRQDLSLALRHRSQAQPRPRASCPLAFRNVCQRNRSVPRLCTIDLSVKDKCRLANGSPQRAAKPFCFLQARLNWRRSSS